MTSNPESDFPSVLHMVVAAAQAAPEREALVCGDVRLTYGEFAHCIAGFARELRANGAKGKRVAAIFGNSIEFCIALLGGHAAGAQVGLINALFTSDEITPLLEDMDATAVVYDNALARIVAPVAERLKVPYLLGVTPGDAKGLLRWRNEPLTIEPDWLPKASDLGLLLYTGGTTGLSKGVDLTHATGVAGVARLNRLVQTRKGKERLLCVAPLCHCYSLEVAMYNMLLSAGTMVIVSRYSAEATLDLLESENITILAGGPTQFVGMLAHESMSRRHFPHLTASLSGGSPLPEETLRRWEATTSAPVLEGYGLTETFGGLSFNPLIGVHKPRSVGLKMADEIQIVDAIDGKTVLAQGETGEIRCRGPQVMVGYRGRPDATATVLRDGWFYTSDIGHIDEDGYLFISDRKKDMVLVSGFNVYPRAIEEVLYKHPDVLEAAVIGEPDDYQGESVKAVIVLKPGAELTGEDIRAYCREHMAPYKVPRRVMFVASLPKTTVGKIDKKQLRQ
ncbi:MAG: AMP-binding protein [Alphaproteobacteria bacterium]|nr:AMP-binding protein [Alphaproteobacteria bacterium]